MCPSEPTCGSPPSGPDWVHSAMNAAWMPGLLMRQVPPESTWWVCTSKMNSPGRLLSCASGYSNEQASSPIGPPVEMPAYPIRHATVSSGNFMSAHDLEGTAHAGMHPAEEGVDAVAGRSERPLGTVLHPLLVVRRAPTQL